MTAPIQRHCRNVAEHDAHDWWIGSGFGMVDFRCPGRFTPRLRGVGITGEPQQPTDPFAGLDDD